MHKEFQQENCEQINKINEYKRNKILQKHQKLTLKINQKKNTNFNTQNNAIIKNILEQNATNAVSEFITKLKRINPSIIDKRRQLLSAIIDINEKFGLKATLEHTRQKRKSVDESDT